MEGSSKDAIEADLISDVAEIQIFEFITDKERKEIEPEREHAQA